MKIIEIHGGSSGTEYVYFVYGNELRHVSQIRGAEAKVSRERGRRRREVVWEVPADEIAGRQGIIVTFTRRGRYPLIFMFKLPKDMSNINELSFNVLYDKGLIDKDIEDPLRYLKDKVRFKLFGPETHQYYLYEAVVPKLVDDLRKDLKSMGIDDVFIYNHAERLGEVLRDPGYALMLSLVLPTPQGRIKSLHEKRVRCYGVWVMGKVIKALHELGAKPLSNKLVLSRTANEPAIIMELKGKYIHVLYQPSILPHTYSMLHELEIPKRVHVLPDVVLLISEKEESIEWSELYRYSDYVPLIVEAKFSLAGRTEYETVDVAKAQVETYRKILGDKPYVIVPIYEENHVATWILSKIPNTIPIDRVNPRNEARVKEFMEKVKEIVKRYIYK